MNDKGLESVILDYFEIDPELSLVLKDCRPGRADTPN